MKYQPYLVGGGSSSQMIKEEVRQLTEEGRDSQWIESLLAQFGNQRSDAELWYELQSAPQRDGFLFHEPSDLDEIRGARGPGMRAVALQLTDEALQDRMLGAWLGRCCGCALGKPVEWFLGGDPALSIRERVKIYLQGASPVAYPLDNYFPLSSSQQARCGSLNSVVSCRENIAFMESDDDIRYTVIAQRILLAKGAEFTTLDIMKEWISTLPYANVATAEKQAYRNFINRYDHAHGAPGEIDWNWVARHQNPYREWIGAQIRADSWGYAAPGQPELAASFAWRDARISHVKNGIYGEMFVAAMIAAAFAFDAPLEVVKAGLAEIPQSSRLYQDIQKTIEICQKHGCDASSFETVLDALHDLLDHYYFVHTNNNAALVVAALLLGGDDFEKVITIAVMGGWDTDCNGATAGSIFGAMHGAKNIPAKWKGPLHDTLYAQIFDYHPIAISECARRSFEIARKIAT